MSEQQRGGVRVSRWTLLPVNLLHLIIPLLARDGVASAAKVWPQAVEDEKIKLFVPGGMPICENCFKCVVSTSVPELVKQEKHDPTGTIARMPDEDDYETFLIHDDIVTLFVGAFLDKLYKQTGAGACLLCIHKPEYLVQLNSKEWQALLGKYADRLSSDLQEFSQETSYAEWGRPSVYESGVLPVVCQRCGDFDCDHGNHCKWFYGEGRILQEFHATLIEMHRIGVSHMAPCQCHSKKKKGGRCACQYCNRTPPRWCAFCSTCCRKASCYHTHPPEPASFEHIFIAGIAGAPPAVPIARR